MKIEQISVFLENKAGRLASLVSSLGDMGINIRAISLADTSDFGIVRMIVNDTAGAKAVLKDRGFTVSLTEVIAVEIADKPGELAGLLGFVETAGLNVEYIYGPTGSIRENAVLILRFDDLNKAIDTLSAQGINILKSSEVLNL